jgi:hypothetical protein
MRRLHCNVNIAQAIQKVRKIVRLFRKSPLNNELLQKYVEIEYKNELKLIHGRQN